MCAELSARGHFRPRIHRLPTPGIAESIQADITDSKALNDAVCGMKQVIHLAATTDDADFTCELLPNNIIAVHTLMEAARQHQVKRVVLASSVQVILGGVTRKKDGPASLEDGTAPKNMYAVTKVFAETIGQMYSLLRHFGDRDPPWMGAAATPGFRPRAGKTLDQQNLFQPTRLRPVVRSMRRSR